MSVPARYVIGIGAQKCASSWLHAVLSQHPGVAVANRKELDFFSYHHDRGHAWYAAQWSAPGLRFENSPSYLHDPRSPERLHRFAPEARVIFTLRDPVERAFSHHLHEIARGHIPLQPFEAALAANPDYLEQGFYARHLSRWREIFGAEAMTGILSEEIAADPGAARRALLRFLDLPPGSEPAVTREPRNVSDRARLAPLRSSLRAGGKALRRVGLEEQLAALKRWTPVRRLLDWNNRPLRAMVAPPTAATRRDLAALFAEDMRALADMLGRRDLPWPSWVAARTGQR